MNKIKLYWEFASEIIMEHGAIPPIDICLELSKPNKDSLLLNRDFISKKRKIESGYIVKPNDCPAILAINNYGLMFKCPGNLKVTLNDSYLDSRIISSEKSNHGFHEIIGEYWPKSDSEKIASWISGSLYTKIHTGIIVYFPKEYLLYQGEIPHGNERKSQDFAVWNGLESYNKDRGMKIHGVDYGIAEMNFIVSPKLNKTTIEIKKDEPLGIAYPVLKKNKFSIEKLNHNR